MERTSQLYLTTEATIISWLQKHFSMLGLDLPLDSLYFKTRLEILLDMRLEVGGGVRVIKA